MKQFAQKKKKKKKIIAETNSVCCSEINYNEFFLQSKTIFQKTLCDDSIDNSQP